jgi:indolepyruvate ferredoxin oxidoreductase beta subunit
VITNLTPLPPFTVAIGKGVYPDLQLVQKLIREKAKKLIAFDATALAKEAGNVLAVNIVLLGALLQTGVLPLRTKDVKEAIIARTGKFSETNLMAFELGFAAAKLN